ncbi:uncharacterized protein BCR38DRAFT_503678 [Pseudomassariella vexata]|uniref:RTA1 like protein-domain-containing protein n=1 Tax=Pseudomassariella vexata TaxID=1141098 RepID=A0A1Y2EG92_9PEZI|nr:uncharacterized protein BCR38DRAFT_503678 [Pseudomassariella vexata]ORY70324.1 hypothetical protein BCR38DRAFT_503678 [Pseudomassariella vexata]
MPASALPAGVKPPFPFYTPSFDLAVVGSAVFSALTVIHIMLLIKTRAWNLNLMPQAALMLGLGMILRLVVITNPALEAPFNISAFLLMLPGSLVAIQLISTYTRLIWWVTPPENRNFNTLWLPPWATSIILVLPTGAGDTLSAIGTGRFGFNAGTRILAVGAVVQMLIFMTFTFLVARFTFISRRWGIHPDKRQSSRELGLSLTASGVFVSIRGIMQVLEKDALQSLITTHRPTPTITTEEWPLWVFDFLPLFAVLAITASYYPGSYFPKRLVGFRLNTKGLLKDEMDRKTASPTAATTLITINGRPDSQPIDLEKEIVSTYAEYMDLDHHPALKYPN